MDDPTQSDGQASTDKTVSNKAQGSSNSVAIWLVACVVATIAISLMAAHAPSRIRLIGLFPIAYGLLIGWLVVVLATTFEVRPSQRLTLIAAIVLVLGGWGAVTWQSFRLDETLTMQSTDPTHATDQQLAQQMMKEFDRQMNQQPTEPTAPSAVQSFQSYLARRIRQLGNWPSPWPECFWLAETIAAAIAGNVMSRRANYGRV